MTSRTIKSRATSTFARRVSMSAVATVILASGTACKNSERYCLAGTHADGDVCSPDIVDCGADSVLQDGKCVLKTYTCGTGTHLKDGVCVPDASACATGAHAEGAVCVPDTIPPPDVAESASGDPVQFTLPASGSSIVLGGVVNTPTDLNGDGYTDANWDTFVFHATAGTYLRFSASGVAGARPAFAISSSIAR